MEFTCLRMIGHIQKDPKSLERQNPSPGQIGLRVMFDNHYKRRYNWKYGGSIGHMFWVTKKWLFGDHLVNIWLPFGNCLVTKPICVQKIRYVCMYLLCMVLKCRYRRIEELNWKLKRNEDKLASDKWNHTLKLPYFGMFVHYQQRYN